MSTLTVDTIKILTQQSQDGRGLYNDNPAFAVTRNYTSTLSMTFASSQCDLTYDATVLNPNTMVNLSTGIATIPTAGIWLFGVTMSISHTSLNHFDLVISANSVEEPTLVCGRPITWASGDVWMSGGLTKMAMMTEGSTAKCAMTSSNYAQGTLTNVSHRAHFWGMLIRRV